MVAVMFEQNHVISKIDSFCLPAVITSRSEQVAEIFVAITIAVCYVEPLLYWRNMKKSS